jgi:hypothetical protein
MTTESPTQFELRDELAEIAGIDSEQAEGLLQVLFKRLVTKEQMEAGQTELGAHQKALERKLNLLAAVIIAQTAVYGGLLGALIARGG